jgi:hypothetical protein
MGNFLSGFILNDYAVSSRSGIAARAAIAVRDEIVRGGIFVRHGLSLQRRTGSLICRAPFKIAARSARATS